MDLSWARRKDITRKLAERKRGRAKDLEDEAVEDDVAGRRHKRIRYSKLEDNWGVGGMLGHLIRY